jgi:NAD(P)-dependent dehydrogenase (short-subunit alcohol dehydrogenase family)
LANLLLPKIVSTQDSRIVVVSSLAHRFIKASDLDLEDMNWTKQDYDKGKAFEYSQVANILFVKELDRRLGLAGTSIKVVACHPGWTETNLRQQNKVCGMLHPLFSGMLPWQGALPTLYAACSPDAESSRVEQVLWPRWPWWHFWVFPLAQDEKVAQKLWELSEDLVEIKFPELPKQ